LGSAHRDIPKAFVFEFWLEISDLELTEVWRVIARKCN